MYTMEQIQEFIQATPQEIKGKDIEYFRPSAVSMGRRLNPTTRQWFMVYLIWQGKNEQMVVACQGKIL